MDMKPRMRCARPPLHEAPAASMAPGPRPRRLPPGARRAPGPGQSAPRRRGCTCRRRAAQPGAAAAAERAAGARQHHLQQLLVHLHGQRRHVLHHALCRQGRVSLTAFLGSGTGAGSSAGAGERLNVWQSVRQRLAQRRMRLRDDAIRGVRDATSVLPWASGSGPRCCGACGRQAAVAGGAFLAGAQDWGAPPCAASGG